MQFLALQVKLLLILDNTMAKITKLINHLDQEVVKQAIQTKIGDPKVQLNH